MRHIGLMFSMLSSILLGLLVQDFDSLRLNFALLFRHSDVVLAADFAARITALMLIVVFLRNIHGAVRYDELLDRGRVKPNLDKTTRGRAFSFACAVSALFLGPSLVGHYIVHHAMIETSSPLGRQSHPLSSHIFTTVLFLPFICYMAWDVMIWLLGHDERTADSRFERVTDTWARIDAVGLALIMMFGSLALWRSKYHTFNYEFMALSFVAIAFVVVTSDYWFNREYYFPDEPNI